MILHIDMDAFYASVEQLDDPDLKGKCVIVGGSAKRGVVSAASYEARKLGVHSAMPIYQAKEKCPDGIFIFPRMARYSEVSKEIMSQLENFSPLVEQISIDEAYMDIGGSRRLLGEPVDIAMDIKNTIKTSVRLTCSIGIAANKFLAKIASDMDKPDGLYVIWPEDTLSFIENLPIQKVPGVGRQTMKKLDRMGIRTLGQVREFPEKTLNKQLGKFGRRLTALSRGIDHSQVMPSAARSSVSTETTLSANTDDRDLLNKYLLHQAEDVGRQLRRMNTKAKTITLKVKHSDFKQITRSITLSTPTHTTETIYGESRKLLSEYPIKKDVRLIGVGASNFATEAVPMQMDLFGDLHKKTGDWDKVDRTVDNIVKKFGKNAVKRAALDKKKS